MCKYPGISLPSENYEVSCQDRHLCDAVQTDDAVLPALCKIRVLPFHLCQPPKDCLTQPAGRALSMRQPPQQKAGESCCDHGSNNQECLIRQSDVEKYHLRRCSEMTMKTINAKSAIETAVMNQPIRRFLPCINSACGRKFQNALISGKSRIHFFRQVSFRRKAGKKHRPLRLSGH